MQFFKTSYERDSPPEYLPFIGHRDDDTFIALTPHFSRKKKKNTLFRAVIREETKGERKKKKKKSEREYSKKHLGPNIDHVMLELFIHPHFLPFFYDRLYTRTRVPFPM